MRFDGVYDGIDLVYYGNAQQLEYDFIIAPGADPASIELQFAGAAGLRLANNVHVTGHTESADFPVVGAAQPEFPGAFGSRPAFAAIGEPLSCGIDATAQVQIFQSAYIPLFGVFSLQLAVVWNPSAAPIEGPVAYVMDDLQGAVYAGSSAQTRCFSPQGDPLTLMPLGGDNALAPNEAALMGVWFYQSQIAPITYTPRLLSGYGGR